MAESLAEKLKRIAREKKEAAAAAEVAAVANGQSKVEEVSDGQASVSGMHGELQQAIETGSDAGCSTDGDSQPSQVSCNLEVKLGIDIADSDSESVSRELTPTPSSHPLAMQFAEMEQALLTADPTFKTILRDVHRHLGKDPALVTLMTEEDVAMVVKGLVVFANAEVVEPAKAKAVKAGVAAAKKKVIGADDL